MYDVEMHRNGFFFQIYQCGACNYNEYSFRNTDVGDLNIWKTFIGWVWF